MRASLLLSEYKDGRRRLIVWMNSGLFGALMEGHDAESGRVSVTFSRDRRRLTVVADSQGSERAFPHRGREGSGRPAAQCNGGINMSVPNWMFRRPSAPHEVHVSAECQRGFLTLAIPRLWSGARDEEEPQDVTVGPKLPRMAVPTLEQLDRAVIVPSRVRRDAAGPPRVPRVYTRQAPEVPPRARRDIPWVDPDWSLINHRDRSPGRPLVHPGDPPPGRSALDQGYRPGGSLGRGDAG